jgi:hypothetical protein
MMGPIRDVRKVEKLTKKHKKYTSKHVYKYHHISLSDFISQHKFVNCLENMPRSQNYKQIDQMFDQSIKISKKVNFVAKYLIYIFASGEKNMQGFVASQW